MGVDALYLQDVLDASFPSGVVNNFYKLNLALGSKEDFDIMVETYRQQEIAVVIKLCVDSTTLESGLFKDDQLRKECYPISDAPNRWQDKQGNSLWHSHQDEYYLSHRGVGFPLLDWHSPVLRSKLGKVVRHWMEQGIKGFVFAGVDKCMYDQCGEKDFGTLHDENLKVVRFLKDVVSERSDCCSIGELESAKDEQIFLQYAGKGLDLLLRDVSSEPFDLQDLDSKLSQWQGKFLCRPVENKEKAKNFRLCLLSYIIFNTESLLLQDNTSPTDLQSYRDDNFFTQIISYKKRAVLGVEMLLQEKNFRGFLLKCVEGVYLLGINFSSEEFVWHGVQSDALELENIKDGELNGGLKRGEEIVVKPFSLMLGKMQW